MLTLFDIRSIDATTDNIAISDGTNTLAVAADGSIAITDNGGSLTVDGTVAATQSGSWDIGTVTSITNDVNIADGGNSITVDDGGVTLSVDDGGGSITVDGTVSISSQAFVYAEDSAHTTADEGAFVLAVRADSKASTAGTDGDYAALIQDADGDLYVTDTVAQGYLATIDADTSALAGTVSGSELQVDVVASLPAGTNIVGKVYISDGTDDLAVNADGSLNVNLTDDGIADDAVDSGNPFKVGGRAVDSSSALGEVAGGDRFDMLGDQHRRLWINESMNVSWAVAAGTTAATAAQIDSSKVSGRKHVEIQNVGSNDMEISNASFAWGAGWLIPKKTAQSFKMGEALDIFAIAQTAGSTTSYRLLQAA